VNAGVRKRLRFLKAEAAREKRREGPCAVLGQIPHIIKRRDGDN